MPELSAESTLKRQLFDKKNSTLAPSLKKGRANTTEKNPDQIQKVPKVQQSSQEPSKLLPKCGSQIPSRAPKPEAPKNRAKLIVQQGDREGKRQKQSNSRAPRQSEEKGTSHEKGIDGQIRALRKKLKSLERTKKREGFKKKTGEEDKEKGFFTKKKKKI